MTDVTDVIKATLGIAFAFAVGVLALIFIAALWPLWLALAALKYLLL